MDMSFLFDFIIALGLIVLIFWAVTSLAAYLPGPLPVIIKVFGVVIVCLWLLSEFSGFSGLHTHFVSHPCG